MCGPNSCLKVCQTQRRARGMQRSCEFHTYSYPRVFTHVRMFRQEETLLQLKVINEIHNTKQKQTRQFGFEGTYCQGREHFPVYKRSKVFIRCVVRLPDRDLAFTKSFLG